MTLMAGSRLGPYENLPFGSPISPDGSVSAVLDADGKVFLCPTEGGSLKPLANLERGEFPIQWSEDNRFQYTHLGGELPAKIWRYELATGRKELFKEISPADSAASRRSSKSW